MSQSRRHIRLISIFTGRNALRGGTGLIFFLAAVFFGLTVSHIVIMPVEHMMAKLSDDQKETVLAQIMEQARPTLEWFLGGSIDEEASLEDQAAQLEKLEAWSAYLLQERPAILSAIFLILLFGMPFVVPLGAFNQTAGDIGNRGLRYLLLRTDRSSIYFGRLLASIGWTLIVHAFVILTVALYVGFKLKLYPAADLASWSIQGFFAISIVSIPYIALCAWLSTHAESSMFALILCNLIIGGVLLLAFLLAMQWEPATYLKYLLPWGVQNNLLSPNTGAMMGTSAACLGYSAVYAFLGWRNFSKRDL